MQLCIIKVKNDSSPNIIPLIKLRMECVPRKQNFITVLKRSFKCSKTLIKTHPY